MLGRDGGKRRRSLRGTAHDHDRRLRRPADGFRGRPVLTPGPGDAGSGRRAEGEHDGQASRWIRRLVPRRRAARRLLRQGLAGDPADLVLRRLVRDRPLLPRLYRAGDPQADHVRRMWHLVRRRPDPHRHGQPRRLAGSTAQAHVIDRRAVAAILVAAAVALPRGAVRGWPVICPFRRVTGLPCPACGLTRSWQAAAEFRVGDSLGFHPLGAATLVGAVATALDEGDGRPLFAERRGLRVVAIGLWLGAWLWSLRRTALARA